MGWDIELLPDGSTRVTRPDRQGPSPGHPTTSPN